MRGCSLTNEICENFRIMVIQSVEKQDHDSLCIRCWKAWSHLIAAICYQSVTC